MGTHLIELINSLIQCIPTWQGLKGFQNFLVSCAFVKVASALAECSINDYHGSTL